MDFDIEQAKNVLTERVMAGDAFAASMLAALLKGKVSEKQAAAIKNIIDRKANAVKYNGIIGMLRASTEQYPKMVATIGGTVITLRYTRADSPKANPENRDTAYVSAGVYKKPDSRWYGRIGKDGTFHPGKDITPEVREWLDGIEAAAAAK